MVRNAGTDRSRLIQPPQHMTQAALVGLDRQIDQAILAKPEAVSLDLSAVQTIDSPGLNWLLAAQSRLAAQGIQFFLHDPSAICHDIFLATRLDARFHFAHSDSSPSQVPAGQGVAHV